MYELETKSFIKAPREKALKREVLRYNEYYNIQSTFDNLYKQSKGGQNRWLNVIKEVKQQEQTNII